MWFSSCLKTDTIHGLMLQLTTDHFMVKTEYKQMTENCARDSINEMYEECEEDLKECVYISDKKENFENNDDENEQMNTEEESGIKLMRAVPLNMIYLSCALPWTVSENAK